uniref:VP2 n=1 Tax=Wuhan carp calicivirus 1 TaxID=2116154 RepID=A0A2P1GNG3_9CALI|nr:VP2 [Wuhan carp calicivirus 1]
MAAALAGAIGGSVIGGISTLGAAGIDAANRLQLQQRDQSFQTQLLDRRAEAFRASGLPESAAYLSGSGVGSGSLGSVALSSFGSRVYSAGHVGPWLPMQPSAVKRGPGVMGITRK